MAEFTDTSMSPWLKRLWRFLPHWLQSSAAQQGMLMICVTIFSLVLMASITLAYVDYQLDNINAELVKETMELTKKQIHELDDDPVEEDEILAVMGTGFLLAGLMVSGLTGYLILRITRTSQKRIDHIEAVLRSAAQGELDRRIGDTHAHNDLARIGRAIDEMLSRLAGSVAAMSDISANIAHELKTPITRLQHQLLELYALTQDAKTSNDAITQQLENALSESHRLADIFDALLRISQIESGHRRNRFARIDITQIIETIGDIYTDVADDAQMQLTVEQSDSPIWLEGDRELLVQLFANVIENAIKYCPPHSSISLSLQRHHDALGETLSVNIQDNGPGIPDSEKSRVFERLYRIDKSRTEGGLGLGLSLIKAITELHHGQITLADANPGLLVSVTLPLAHE
ncbi:sensor histidine kinase [Vibrio agarilyticus]|nr:ATP-binding protein [Vibrio agarilyticus]